MRIILASESLKRGKALELLGLEYEKIPSNYDESQITESNPLEKAKILAEEKVKVLAEKENGIIVGGDLFVVLNRKEVGKPKNEEEAFQMFKELSGNKCEMIAGVAVYNSETKKLMSDVEKCTLKFRDIEDYEIKDYILKYPVTKFAAAFDGDAMLRFCESSEGNYPSLTGLPMQKLIKILRVNGLKV